MTTLPEWEQRIADLWATINDYAPTDFLAAVEALTAELPPGTAIALFELASANDSTGHPHQAASLYRQAPATGLTGVRRRRAVIQLASTLRNLGRPDESVALLTAEREAGSDDLDDAVVAFLSLALVDTGREREAAALALGALSRHLPRYNRSLANYAKALTACLVVSLIGIAAAVPAPAADALRCATPRATPVTGGLHRNWIKIYTKPSPRATIMSYTIAAPLPLWVVADSAGFSRVTTGDSMSEWPFKPHTALGWVRTSDIADQAIRNCT